MRWLDGISDTMDMNLGRLWETVRDREARCAALHGVSWTHNNNWKVFVGTSGLKAKAMPSCGFNW